jgi:predicted DNA-binding transcriptional regulator AlpA
MRSHNSLPPSLPPRGLRREAAASYIGVSPSKFDELVTDGLMPKPKRINRRTIWDRFRLDEAFEALPSDKTDGNNPWDLPTHANGSSGW